MTRPAAGTPVETRWEGRFITVKQQGNWEYVSRSRGIHAADLTGEDGSHDTERLMKAFSEVGATPTGVMREFVW